jgi:hypothetical protein
MSIGWTFQNISQAEDIESGVDLRYKKRVVEIYDCPVDTDDHKTL